MMASSVDDLIRRAATHRWMGQALLAYPDGDLRAILRMLETVAFGEVHARDGALDRSELLVAVHDLDLKLEAMRRREQARPVAAERLEAA